MNAKNEQTIWIARHGTRIDVVDPTWKETADRPFDPHLAEAGLLQAERLAARLAGEPLDAVYASPFLRALQTAAPVARATGAPLRIEPGMCEWLHAEWFECVPVLLPDAEVGWACEAMDAEYCSPAAMRHPETWEEMAARTGEAVLRLAATGESFLLVGHGATVIGAVAALQGLEVEHVPPPPTASLSKLVRHGESWRLEFDRDVTHLNGHAEKSGK